MFDFHLSNNLNNSTDLNNLTDLNGYEMCIAGMYYGYLHDTIFDEQKSIKALEYSVNLENSYGMVALSNKYNNKNSNLYNANLYKSLLDRAFNLDNIFAIAKIAIWHSSNESIKNTLLQKAINSNILAAKAYQEFLYIKNGNKGYFSKGISNLIKLCNEGNVVAPYILAKIYMCGLNGSKHKYKKAYQYFQKAHDAGYIISSMNLARCHFDGIYVKRNPIEGFKILYKTDIIKDDNIFLIHQYMRTYSTDYDKFITEFINNQGQQINKKKKILSALQKQLFL